MEWFRHDSNANLDEKLQEVLLDYGLEGYGLYWYCVELIVGKTSAENITFELKHDARIIARNTGSTVKRVEEVMKRFISLGLFENTSGRITCLKIAKRLMGSATSNPQMRNLIKDIKSSHDDIMTASDKITPDKIRIDKKDKKDKKEEKDKIDYIDKKTTSRTIVLDDGFDEFWNYYPKKVGKDAAKKIWKKKIPSINDVIVSLDWQKTSTQWTREDGKYIPNPATYLNQGRWQDEPPVIDLMPF